MIVCVSDRMISFGDKFPAEYNTVVNAIYKTVRPKRYLLDFRWTWKGGEYDPCMPGYLGG